MPRARAGPGSDFQSFAVREAGSLGLPPPHLSSGRPACKAVLESWALGPTYLPCIISVTSYLPVCVSLVCVCVYYNCKKPQKSLPYLEPQHSAPPWETRPHLLRAGGHSGVWSRLPAEREGSRAWGAGLGNWLWPEQVRCRRFLLASPLAFRCSGCCQGNSQQPFPGPAQAHQSLLFLLQPLGFEVGLFRRLNPGGRPAFECLSCTWVILEALPLRRCVTGG